MKLSDFMRKLHLYVMSSSAIVVVLTASDDVTFDVERGLVVFSVSKNDEMDVTSLNIVVYVSGGV